MLFRHITEAKFLPLLKFDIKQYFEQKIVTYIENNEFGIFEKQISCSSFLEFFPFSKRTGPQ